MRKIFKCLGLISLIVLLTASFVYSDNLKAILVIADDYINPANNNIAQSVRKDLELVTKFLDLLNYKNVINVEKTVLRGRNASVKKIKDTIKNLNITNNDVLFFYYSGHGGMTKNKTFIWPCDETNLFRDDLENIVNKKKARLKFIITDACSSSIDSMVNYSFALGSRAAARGTHEDTETFKKLFYNYKGLMYITSATEGQYAWGGPEGGAFTLSFFMETLLQSPKASWQKNFEKARESTEKKFQYSYRNGGFDSGTMEDLRNKGIDNQSPKTYSMVTHVNNANTDSTSNESAEDTNVDTSDAKTKTIITNYTDYSITFSIEDNKAKGGYNYYTIEPYATLTITGDKDYLTIAYDKGNGQYDNYSLESGDYHFAIDENSLIQLYTTIEDEEGNPTQTGKTKVFITNGIQSIINLSVEYGTTVQNYTLKPTESVVLESEEEYLFVSYDKGTGQVDSYGLEQGSYVFGLDDKALPQLYYVGYDGEYYDDSYQEDYYETYSGEIYLYNYSEWDIEFTLQYSDGTSESIYMYGYDYITIPSEDSVLITFTNGYSQYLESGIDYVFVYNENDNQIYLLTYEEFEEIYGGGD